MIDKSQKHIIRKQAIEIDFERGSDGFALQDKVSELIYERLLPGMEVLFDEFGKDWFFSFDTLNVDCGVLSPKHWEEEWVSETLRALREQLLAAHKTRTDTIWKGTKLQELLLFYVQHAYLPWNNNIVSLNELEAVELEERFMGKLKTLIQSHSNAARQLVCSFSETFVKKIVQLLAEKKEVDISTIDSIISPQGNTKERRHRLERIVEVLCSEGTEILTETSIRRREDSSKQNLRGGEENAIYISNAGLVILHPFLQQLFENCGLIQEKQWVDDEMSHQIASRMLQFLVWAADDFTELNAVLNRVLCGLDVAAVILEDGGLTEDIKQECEMLLTEVISHWKVLKNTGTEAFRETFLQRSGKLMRVENGWLLQVEQKTFDVLLSSLPWGIGTIKLPWMKDILYVEWA